MNKASFSIHPVLRELCHKDEPELHFWGNPSVKDLIESLGVPHVEVGRVRINNHEVAWEEQVKDEDRIDIEPVNWRAQSPENMPLRSEIPDSLRFISDVHLGKLTRTMRLLGLDTMLDTSFSDEKIIEIGIREERFILTRDKDLLKQSNIKFGHWMRNTDPRDQMDEVLLGFDLVDQINPFSRCISCNGILKPVKKHEIENELPPRVRSHFDVFQRCDHCRKVFWKGSHYERMVQRLWKHYGIEM